MGWKSKPSHLCKNNPKIHLQRLIGSFLHSWDRFVLSNPPLKPLDYYNWEYEFLLGTPCDHLDNYLADCFRYSSTVLNELWTIFWQCFGQFWGQFVNAVCMYIINTPTPLVTSWSLIISLVSLQWLFNKAWYLECAS